MQCPGHYQNMRVYQGAAVVRVRAGVIAVAGTLVDGPVQQCCCCCCCLVVVVVWSWVGERREPMRRVVACSIDW